MDQATVATEINETIIDSATTRFDYGEFKEAFSAFPDDSFPRRIVGLVIGGLAVSRTNDEIAESINNLLLPLSLTFPQNVLDDFLANKAVEMELEILALQLNNKLMATGAPLLDVLDHTRVLFSTGRVDETFLARFLSVEE